MFAPVRNEHGEIHRDHAHHVNDIKNPERVQSLEPVDLKKREPFDCTHAPVDDDVRLAKAEDDIE